MIQAENMAFSRKRNSETDSRHTVKVDRKAVNKMRDSQAFRDHAETEPSDDVSTVHEGEKVDQAANEEVWNFQKLFAMLTIGMERPERLKNLQLHSHRESEDRIGHSGRVEDINSLEHEV